MFPLSVSGSVRLKLGFAPGEQTIQAASARIADMLDEKIGGSTVDRVVIDGNVVSFRLPWFRLAWNWNILVPFDAGNFQVSARREAIVVHYSMSTVAMLTIVSVLLAVLLAYAGWNAADPASAIRSAAPWIGVAWLWLFGMNYLIAAIRFPLWLRIGLRKDPELKRR